jgi:membrane protein YqaA with SNARE-associated domain
VFLIALADSAFIPMPQGVDALLLAQAIATPATAYWAAGLGALGSVIGSVALYFLAKRAGQAMLRRRISEHGILRLSDLVGRWGAAALIPVTMVPLPLPMKPVVLAAGIFQMPLGWFCLAVGFSRVVRYFGVVFLGIRYGDRAMELAADHLYLVLAACALLVALFVAIHRLSNRWLNR